MSVEQAPSNTYQWMLRALGAYLDEEPSCRISLTEVPDGFLVRLQRALHRLEPQVVHFKRETLKEQLNQLTQQKKPMGSRPHHQGVWSYFPNGHQDFLRALGYELDEASAQNVFLDELEDGFVVTYTCPDTAGSSGWTKKMVVLGIEQIEAILNAAFERRKKAPSSAPQS